MSSGGIHGEYGSAESVDEVASCVDVDICALVLWTVGDKGKAGIMVLPCSFYTPAAPSWRPG